jgi:hypothetical protein
MNQQCFAFDAPAKISRKSDPITSQKSAAETEPKLSTCVGRMLTVLRESQSALTGREAGRKCALRWPDHEADTYRKRISKMVDDGLAVEAGEKVCDVSGKMVTTYKAKEQQ